MRPLERRSLNPRLCSRNVLVNGLRFFWVIAIIWCEVGVVFYCLSGCKWPDKQLSQPGSNTRPTHVLVVSDPQVKHPGSLSWIGALRQSISHSTLKKNWNVARRLNPQAIICLGDMLASGRTVKSDQEYEQYYKWFREMFPVDPSTPIYYLPGNNDVGLGRSVSFSKNARRRFMKHFGPVNQAVSIGGHKLVLLDAPGLVEEDYQRHALGQRYDRWTPISGGPVQFVKSIAAGERTQPVILFSHIPLSHPETKSCGPLREEGTIRRGVGPGYQNTLDKQTTEFLLESIRPLAVFSGDDRDYCEYTHAISPANPDATKATFIREVTVKSFSPARNIRRPGFQLLSLVPSTLPRAQLAAQTFADVPCFLPDQSAIIMTFYFPSLVITIAILVLSNAYRARHQLRLSPFPSPISLPSHPNNSPGPHSHSLHSHSTTHSRQPSWTRTPWTPMTPSWPGENEQFPRVSPRSSLPPTLRTPSVQNNFTAPTYRASSRPATPHDSPLLIPTVVIQHDDEEDDTMFPPQYAVRRDHRPGHNANAWPSGYDEEDHEDEAAIFDEKATAIKRELGHKRRTSHFLPAPGNKPSERRNWSYSWTFVFRDRRRRIIIPLELPALDSVRDVASELWNWRGTSHRRRGLLRGVAADGISVAWPALLVWGVIMRWMF